MFRTTPEDELRVPNPFAPAGGRAWRCVEFAVNAPFYLVRTSITLADGEQLGQHLLVGTFRDVLALAARQDSTFQIAEVGLLSPSYMNEGEGYQLDQVKEVWSSSKGGQGRIFVTADGKRLKFAIEETDDDEEMELVLSL